MHVAAFWKSGKQDWYFSIRLYHLDQAWIAVTFTLNLLEKYFRCLARPRSKTATCYLSTDYLCRFSSCFNLYNINSESSEKFIPLVLWYRAKDKIYEESIINACACLIVWLGLLQNNYQVEAYMCLQKQTE